MSILNWEDVEKDPVFYVAIVKKNTSAFFDNGSEAKSEVPILSTQPLIQGIFQR